MPLPNVWVELCAGDPSAVQMRIEFNEVGIGARKARTVRHNVEQGQDVVRAAICGNWVDNIGEEGHRGAVLVRLGQEAFWFCGVACARNFLDQMCSAIYEGRGSLDCMLWNTISEN